MAQEDLQLRKNVRYVQYGDIGQRMLAKMAVDF